MFAVVRGSWSSQLGQVDLDGVVAAQGSVAMIT